MNKITFSIVITLIGSVFGHAQSLSRLNEAPIEKSSLEIEGVYFDVSDTGHNSELTEIGCTEFRGKYLITSNKKRGFVKSYKNAETGQPNKNIFCADIKDDNNLDYPLVFSKILNSSREQGSLTFSPDGDTVYFTRSKDDSEMFSLYKADLNLDSKYNWDSVEELVINDDSYSVETPFVGESNPNKIYVASDKPGGYGGFDIYEAQITKSGHVVKMKNLGPLVNSAQDEKYPFMDESGRHFYFSSNGHKGYGNYDVFRVSVKDGKFDHLSNMGNSLNTKSDDVAFYLLDHGSGYISTNEIDNEEDYNVYKFDIVEVQQNIAVDIIELKNGKALEEVDVVVTDEYGDIIKKTKTDKRGQIRFKGDLLSEYTIATEKSNYVAQTKFLALENNNQGKNSHKVKFLMKEYPFFGTVIDTDSKVTLPNSVVNVYNKDNILVTKAKADNKGNFKLLETPSAPFYVEVEGYGYYNSNVKINEDLTRGQSMHKTLELIKVEAEIVKNAVVVNNKSYDAINVENILFDFDKSSIKKESYETLHKVYNLMKGKRDINIVINAHTDTKGSEGYNAILSELRAMAVYTHLINEGISKDRLKFKSYGESQPIKNCNTCSDEENAENRRVEFVLE